MSDPNAAYGMVLFGFSVLTVAEWLWVLILDDLRERPEKPKGA